MLEQTKRGQRPFPNCFRMQVTPLSASLSFGPSSCASIVGATVKAGHLVANGIGGYFFVVFPFISDAFNFYL